MNKSNNIITPDGFTELLSGNAPRLKRIALSYGASDWQDLLQEIHLQLWRSRDGFRGDSETHTWLYRVAINTAISFNRGKKIATQVLEAKHERGTAGQPLDQTEMLREFLNGLNQANRTVLLLFLEGLSNEQIADVIGTSAASVATRLTRLRQQFEQTYLEDN
ncbi:MAG: sigma-70 family RNA polymerase sigma factor [Gammaproteobacteria bacterium]|nr:sigma-70 family RNA polymerase sigma factor [Gammaproteobacteria bacterium]